MRYLLQKSKEDPMWWVLTDTDTHIVCRFREGEFNDTQKYTLLDDENDYDLAALPGIVSAMSEWLREKHYEIIFSSPQKIRQEAREKIGNQLREAREKKGYTLRQLSFLTGIAFNHIGRIEAGKYNVTIDTVSILANALGVSLIIS